jgi:hypothetical protein
MKPADNSTKPTNPTDPVCTRLYMVNQLLLTCCDYFDKATNKRVERFLAYLERYTFLKGSVPIEVCYIMLCYVMCFCTFLFTL